MPAPLRAELGAIVRMVDPRATIVTLSPDAGPAPRADAVLAITATDFPRHPDLMAPDYNADNFGGRLASTVVAIGVRPGNPLNIRGWGDLLNPRARVALADPLGRDGDRLAVLSAVIAIVAARKHNAPAKDYVRRLLSRADVARDDGDAVDRFASGEANVVVTTENRLIAARDRGVALQIIHPPSPMPIAVAAGVARSSAHPVAAQALIDRLHDPGPQKALARAGMRPVLVGYAPPDRFSPLGRGHTPAILGKPALVDRSYFGPRGVVAQALALARARPEH